jgi:hypothetical protein
MKRTPNLERLLVASSARPNEGETAYRAAADMSDVVTVDEARSILGIAFEMATVDGPMTGDERVFYGALIEYVAQRVGRDAAVEASESVAVLSGTPEDRVRLHAGSLVRLSARVLAYKVAYALRVWDLEANPSEEQLDELLVEALELGDLSKELAGEVNGLLMEADVAL